MWVLPMLHAAPSAEQEHSARATLQNSTSYVLLEAHLAVAHKDLDLVTRLPCLEAKPLPAAFSAQLLDYISKSPNKR